MALILWDGAGIYVFTTVVKKALQLNVKPLTAELSQVGTCGKEAMVFVCFGSLCVSPLVSGYLNTSEQKDFTNESLM